MRKDHFFLDKRIASMVCTPTTESDFLQVAKLHKQGLGHLDYFLSRCSVSFIKFFYKAISKYDSSIIIVDKEESGKIRGFAFGSTEKDKLMMRFFKEKFFRMTIYISAFLPIWLALFRRLQRNMNIDYDNELLYMAVFPEYRGQGVGKKLLIEMQKKFSERGYKLCYLQVHAHNKSAHSLYLSMGYEEIHRYKIGKVEKIVMSKSLAVMDAQLKVLT